MCGIAGAIDLTGKRLFPNSRLVAMTDALAHRGPDDEWWHREEGVALGVRRLSILDLDGGRQPIANEAGDVWVAFNGELFDYPDLRRELLSRGHRLATRCDTEAWVHLFEEHGEDVFQRTRGQFAVAIWDRGSRSLYLGRDRVGIRPLHYAESDGWLLWASEIKALLASGLVEARPDPKGIDHFFTFFCTGTTRTCFEGVRSIPPGHFLRIRDGKVQLRKYWDLDFPDAGDERREDPEKLTDELAELLERSVERRLQADVPVVSYISGGLDSTVVLGLVTRLRDAAVPSFTIGLDRAGPDERAHASEAARVLGSRLTTVTMDRADIARSYPALVRAAEAPVFDTSSACMVQLAKTVREQGYKVALSGEGADEALAGYIWFRFGFPRYSRTLRNLLLSWIGGGRRHAPPFPGMRGVLTVQQWMYDVFAQSRELLYSDALWSRLDGHSAYDDLDLTQDRMARWHPRNRSIYAAYKIMLPGHLLSAKGDRAAMSSSVETRYPFLDESVIEFCAGIDPDYKLRGRQNKWLLRQVARRSLPPRIARRPKTMFRATWSGTFLGPQRPPWVDQLLSRESLVATGLFDPRSVHRARKLLTRWPRVSPQLLALDFGLTMVVSTQLWHQTYCGGGLADLPTWPAGSVEATARPSSACRRA